MQRPMDIEPNNETNLILASASPRRAQLLRQAGYRFEVVEPPFDEPDDMSAHIPAVAQAEALSYFKARGVRKLGFEGIIIGADTIVVHDGEIFGKPDDLRDAQRILQAIAGTTHQVITGLSLIDTKSNERIITHDTTTVTMRPMSDEALGQYLAGGQWKGKAGAYGIQDHGDVFIERIDGSFTNVVGLPMEILAKLLDQWGVKPNGTPAVKS